MPRGPGKKREPEQPATRRVLPMELRIGDRLADETGEWKSSAGPTPQREARAPTRASSRKSTNSPMPLGIRSFISIE
jgi:hypothetical protein